MPGSAAEGGDRAQCDLVLDRVTIAMAMTPYPISRERKPLGHSRDQESNLLRPPPSKPLFRRAWWTRLSPGRHQGELKVGQLFTSLTWRQR